MSKKEIVVIEREVVGTLGHTIHPGDKIFTFTQVYGRGTRCSRGIFRGVREVTCDYGYRKGSVDTTFVVEREEGKRTFLNYAGMVPANTQLDELHDKVL